MRKVKNYIVIFKDSRIHIYSSRNDREFLKMSVDFETDFIFKVEGTEFFVKKKTKEIQEFSIAFINKKVGRELISNLFREFLFDPSQKTSSFLSFLKNLSTLKRR